MWQRDRNCPRRHHRVKHLIMDLLKEKGYECMEEVYGVDSQGTTRYADIIAFKGNCKLSWIIDPTVHLECSDLEQATKIHEEKKEIYEKCILFNKEKFRERFGKREYAVRGLWFRARGTVPRATWDFLEGMGIEPRYMNLLAESIIIDSLGIINHHIYDWPLKEGLNTEQSNCQTDYPHRLLCCLFQMDFALSFYLFHFATALFPPQDQICHKLTSIYIAKVMSWRLIIKLCD